MIKVRLDYLTIALNSSTFKQSYDIFLCLLQGWEDGVIGMKKGSKRLLVIPPSLAYGDKVEYIVFHR